MLQQVLDNVERFPGLKASGRVTQIIGLLIESLGPQCALGEICTIFDKYGNATVCEVVGFKEDKVLLMSLGEMTHFSPGAEVYPSGQIHRVAISDAMLGRVLDGLGNPIDGKGPIDAQRFYPAHAKAPNVMARTRIKDVLSTGVRSIDATCTAGRGQRFGIFAGSGVGKSTLLGMIARLNSAEVTVIGLIGERGREVREFIERDLGPAGLERSIVVVATSDEPALVRAKGACVATAIAESFRDQGKSVVLMMDSVTRYAMALREIGLAIGEPPTTKGYTPSVFAALPKLLERAGTSAKGSITGIYTILVEGDDMNDPIADTARSILDGHIVLSRRLAAANHFPAVDVLESLSRVMSEVAEPEHIQLASKLRDILQTYKEAEDLINIGAYVAGSNPKIDLAISLIGPIRDFLKQKTQESVAFKDIVAKLKSILK